MPGARAVCVEPVAANLEIGRRNLARNSRTARIIQAAVGETYRSAAEPAADRIDTVEQLDMATLLDRIGHEPIQVIHLDVQGVETGFLRSMRRCRLANKLRFVVLSTHHELYSGSRTTHDDCLEELRTQGAVILVEHSVAESFSGDGLIVASFDLRDRGCSLLQNGTRNPNRTMARCAPLIEMCGADSLDPSTALTCG